MSSLGIDRVVLRSYEVNNEHKISKLHVPKFLLIISLEKENGNSILTMSEYENICKDYKSAIIMVRGDLWDIPTILCIDVDYNLIEV